MTEEIGSPSSYGLENHGLKNLKKINWSLSAEQLLELSVSNQEGKLSEFGGLVALTGKHTGRAPNDKFTVRSGESGKKIWWGDVNKSITAEQFEKMLSDYYEKNF